MCGSKEGMLLRACSAAYMNLNPRSSGVPRAQAVARKSGPDFRAAACVPGNGHGVVLVSAGTQSDLQRVTRALGDSTRENSHFNPTNLLALSCSQEVGCTV